MVSVEHSLPIVIQKCIGRGCKKVQTWILVWNVIRLLTDLVFIGSFSPPTPTPTPTHPHPHTPTHTHTPPHTPTHTQLYEGDIRKVQIIVPLQNMALLFICAALVYKVYSRNTLTSVYPPLNTVIELIQVQAYKSIPQMLIYECLVGGAKTSLWVCLCRKFVLQNVGGSEWV